MAASLSLVLPVYNEAELLPSAVEEIDEFLRQHFEDYELVIVESGSADESSRISDTLARQYAHVRVIHEGARNGFGSAVRLGFRSATKALLCVITADLPYSLQTIGAALPHLERCDAVLSYRSRDRRSPWRKLQSSFYNALARRLLGLRIRHVNSAFKLIKRSVLETIPLHSRGWFIDTELIYRLENAGIPYAEIPVELSPRTAGRSSVSAGAPLAMLRELFLFKKRVADEKRAR